MLIRVFMMLKFVLCNILVANLFYYLLLIMFDDGYVIEKNNLNTILIEEYKMIYIF